MDRRIALGTLLAAPVAAACRTERPDGSRSAAPVAIVDPVKGAEPLGFQWRTLDPFLFCVHHDDAYPAGNEQLGPATSLAGRNLGMDFAPRDGFRMYHGAVVPGFPQHPHRGFETITIVRRGLVDHADSLGAAARYGGGDVQWLTAGAGIVHAEMFPLLDRQAGNPLELFQIWLNLPARDKLAAPHFSMLWRSEIPRRILLDEAGRSTEITIIAGRFADGHGGELRPPAPPPKSWATGAGNDVAIWTLKMAKGARFTLPAAAAGRNRMLYFFRGDRLRIAGHDFAVRTGIELRADAPATLENGDGESELLMLQARPIEEPVAQHGPFVMNTRAELQQAYADYRATQFGGWPWPKDDPVHDRQERFARHADGHVEKAT